MYYVLFHHTTGTQNFRSFESDVAVIDFLHQYYKKIEVIDIIEVKTKYRLGLVVTEDYIKSELVMAEETESLVPVETKPEEIIKKNKEKLEELEEKPSAMEKIINETEEEELTDEEKVEKQIDEADQLIEREKKRQKQKDAGWKLCIACNSNRVAPWNKKKTCSPCQAKRKTTRPYVRHKEFKGL